MKFTKQIDKEVYGSSKYFDLERWSSYFYQIKEVLNLKSASVLEIGVGDKTMSSYLKNNTSIQYKSLDLADDLKPDILGNVLNMPLPNGSFDAVVAFQVLEHLPFENFEQALKEIGRVAKNNVIISLPHFGPSVRFYIKFPFIDKLKFCLKFPLPIKHKFNGEHYWEIGKKDYSLKKIKSIISSLYTIEKDFLVFENPYHHFFVLSKKF